MFGTSAPELRNCWLTEMCSLPPISKMRFGGHTRSIVPTATTICSRMSTVKSMMLRSVVEIRRSSLQLMTISSTPITFEIHDLRSIESTDDVLNSTMRQRRVERRLNQMRGRLTVERMFEILSDHSNYPRSVCKHYDEIHNQGAETVGSVVVDLTAGEIHVRAGHPCEATTTTIKLTA